MFLGFHCIFLTCYMPPSMFTRVLHVVLFSTSFPLVVTGISQLVHRFPNIVTTFLPVSTVCSTVSCGYFLLFCRFSLCFVFCQVFFITCIMLPTIFTVFLYGFLYHFLSPLASCISCIFNIFFQEFYSSPSVSDRFCTISSGCYRIFLHFHCIFPACLLHRHGLRLAFAPVSSKGFSMVCSQHSLCFRPFSRGFCTISSDRCHVFLQFHCVPIHPHGLSGHQKGGPRGQNITIVANGVIRAERINGLDRP